MTVNPDKLDAFVGRFAADLGAVMHTATVLIGDELGLYRAMGDSAPVTVSGLAERTGLDERWLAEWLAAQAASGYVDYDPATDTFRLPEEQAFALTNEFNPLFVPGGLQVAASTIKDAPLLAAAVREGRGVDWGEHHEDLFEGTERFFRPNYIGNLVDQWLPALDGDVITALQRGARVADVGCGFGASTLIMAEAFPASTFHGYDLHAPSMEAARKRAADAGLADRVTFETASADDFPGDDYDLIAFFDSFHDLGDPAAAARRAREALAPHGSVMLVEPAAGDRLEDNLNPVGRIFYSASTTICTLASKAQRVGEALGAQAGEARLRDILVDAGFASVKRVAETPFNIVLQATP